MELRGTVLNVVDFGAFVDVGLKDSGLVHISQMANRYIKSPYEVVAVNDVVTVWVKSIDAATRHVSLTMIKPGTEQKPPERRPAGDGGGDRRGPRGPRRGPQQQGQQQGQTVGNEGGQQNQPQQQDNRPPRDNRDNRGPSDRGPRRHDSRPGDRRPQHAGGRSQEPRRDQGPPPPPPPPPKPRRELPKPKLSQEAIEGKVPLRTFRELSALFAAKNEPPKPPEPVKQPDPPAKVEEAKPEPSAESTPTPSP